MLKPNGIALLINVSSETSVKTRRSVIISAILSHLVLCHNINKFGITVIPMKSGPTFFNINRKMRIAEYAISGICTSLRSDINPSDNVCLKSDTSIILIIYGIKSKHC